MEGAARPKDEPISGVLLVERALNKEGSPILYEAARTWSELVAMCTNHGDRRMQMVRRVG